MEGDVRLYRELLDIQEQMHEVAERSEVLHSPTAEDNRDVYHQAYRDFAHYLERLTRRQLILIYACGQIGDTGMGKRFEMKGTNCRIFSHYRLPLYESADSLLERYARYSAFWSRPKLTAYLSRYTSTNKNFEFGLDILQEAARYVRPLLQEYDIQPDLVQKVLDEEEPPIFTAECTLIVGMDNSDSVYTFFEFREVVALCIEWLQDRFYDWMYGQKGIHPFRWHQEHIEPRRRTFEGWVYIQGPDDFVDWINTYVYGEPVGRELKTCPLQAPATKLSF